MPGKTTAEDGVEEQPGVLDPAVRRGTRAGSRSRRAPTPAEHRSTQRRDIQGMRAMAVLLVLVNHAELGRLFTGGYVGVDVFFVLSGFLITGGLAREIRSTGRVSFAGFYARRARRILPAATATLVLTLLASAFVYQAADLDKVSTDVIWAAFFAANLHFAQSGNDYFALSTFETPVQHFWSLAVEEQFYLVWPVLLMLVTVLPRARRVATGPRAARAYAALRRVQALRRATLLIAVLCLLSLGWSVYDTGASPSTAYFSTFTRGWELGLGALLALIADQLSRLPAGAKAVLSWVGLAAVLLAGISFTATTAFPGHAALLPVLGAAAMVAGGIDGPRYGATAVLGVAPMRFIGDISYSIYLVHWPLLVLATAWAGGHLGTGTKSALTALSIGLAWLCYRFVETPFRRIGDVKGRRTIRTRRVLAMWPAALVATVVPAFAIGQAMAAAPTTTSASAQQKARSKAAAPDAVSTLRDQVVTAAARAKSGAALPAKLSPSLANLAGDRTSPPDACWSPTKGQITHKICPEGDTTSSDVMVVWGDSHAGQWLKPLAALAKQHHLKLIPLTKASCLPADVVQTLDGGGAYQQCATYRKWALQQITRLKPKLVVVTGLLATPILDPDSEEKLSDSAGTERFAEGSARTLKTLSTLTDRVDVLSDQSRLTQEATTCLSARSADMSSCAKPPTSVTTARNAAWKRSAEQNGARFINMMPWECANGICPLVVDGTIVYRDDHHLSTTYTVRLQPVLAKEIDFPS